MIPQSKDVISTSATTVVITFVAVAVVQTSLDAVSGEKSNPDVLKSEASTA
jgi:hypothetical protein